MAGRKLKVFQAQFGFYDTVIAAASQAAALRAWGTRQNLFASGEAKLADDQAAVAVALKHPETPLRRAVGSRDAFQIEPTSLPKVPHASKPPAPKTAATKRGAKAVASPAPKRAPDRRHLDAAKAALRALENARKREETDLSRRQDELDDAKAAAQAAYVAGRKAAMAAILEARKAFCAAGGEG